MNWLTRICVFVVIGFCGTSFLFAQENQENEDAKIALYFVETELIDGVTEEDSYQYGESAQSVGYLHLEPALILKPKIVEGVELISQEFATSVGDREYYRINVTLTEEARKKLRDQVEGNEMRLLTMVIDSKKWNLYRYELDEDKSGVPRSSRASQFNPMIGLFADKAEAEKVLAALR
jgi:hypothetical protein